MSPDRRIGRTAAASWTLIAVAVAATPAAADPMPPGALGVVGGGVAGTGADAKRIGAGYTFGVQAAWQPMNTDRRWGWGIRWATLFGNLYSGSAAQIEPSLRTVQMDVTGGVRARPWPSASRYLTFRGGVEALRLNEPLPPGDHRSFVGGIAEVGIDQYLGRFLLDVDVRYGLLSSDPSNIALLIGFAITGP
jgi:hypothetical protein